MDNPPKTQSSNLLAALLKYPKGNLGHRRVAKTPNKILTLSFFIFPRITYYNFKFCSPKSHWVNNDVYDPKTMSAYCIILLCIIILLYQWQRSSVALGERGLVDIMFHKYKLQTYVHILIIYET